MLKMHPDFVEETTHAAQDVLTDQLMEYQNLKEKIHCIENKLEEFCSAIEDFGITRDTDFSQDNRIIYCRAKNYTPRALLEEARHASDLLEQASQEMVATKGRMLSHILAQTDDIEQYRAVRFACMDCCDQLLDIKAKMDCPSLQA